MPASVSASGTSVSGNHRETTTTVLADSTTKGRSTAHPFRFNLGIRMPQVLNQALTTALLPLQLLQPCLPPHNRASPTLPLKHTHLNPPNPPTTALRLVAQPPTRNQTRDMALSLKPSPTVLPILAPTIQPKTRTRPLLPLTTPTPDTTTPLQHTNRPPLPTPSWKDSTVECMLLRRGTRRPPQGRA